ncbi:merR regulatory family protein [Clostridium argentinense CDC 2741]|uniref:MerR regulatory family protein n=1 Tax=Clostridium argentinense CDC 2741 TaxID=1418104 RepID=A0A0C1QYA9_9CLOT|nr:MerR family transcriptional regulator [Clostridium argentinense]ARC83408.1 MerR family transcriptional regulator [Clostridium argentinense]KIE45987.1 merR regulatory family protein [Clostridium argentinense CDC 2741]NFF39146.1 MerR family transcriptional regulator [Clostridium argentinense]NFP49558.1 MerR family transcriptional regulator [Clostridium argentinense]NFP72261.1 MerR family transcriptional regulator [Clostridium argentinense]
MRTVKQVSDLTGISVRTLHYYDEIGLLKPSKITEAGYRLYDDEALKTLQQILFFKELDIPLKEIKDIMTSPYFDKMQALKNQKKLLILKRKRLNGLIELINKTLKGESTMNFKEFDMSEYFNVLEEFKTEHEDRVIEIYGSVDKYNDLIEKIKSKEYKIAKSAIKQYGSIERYAKAIKKSLNNDMLTTMAEQYDKFKKDCLEDKHPKLKELYKKLVSDLSKDPSSKEIQQIAGEITNTAKKDYEIFKMENGDEHWYYMIKIYLVYPEWIEAVDKKYGHGASKFIGEALKNCVGNKQPKLEELHEKLASDLSKDPTSKEIQQIVEEISYETKKSHEFYKVDGGDNYLGYMAELYISNSSWINVTDKKFGAGASRFIGEAFKFYAENNK